jgi:hypothetical protein
MLFEASLYIVKRPVLSFAPLVAASLWGVNSSGMLVMFNVSFSFLLGWPKDNG